MNRQPRPRTGNDAPWYRQKVFWILLSGPIAVVIAGFFTWHLARGMDTDLVSDDYYKDGKHINLEIKRDVEAEKRHIVAQVLLNDEQNAAKIFISGDFDRKQPLNLTLMHPAKKSLDQTAAMKLQPAASGDKAEYTASFKTLPETNHWYLRVSDQAGTWRVEGKWLPSQGLSSELLPLPSVHAAASAP